MTDPDADKLDGRQDGLGERLAHLEGVVATEDKLLEREVGSVRHAQMLIIGVVAIMIPVAIALLIYVLQRLDSLAHH